MTGKHLLLWVVLFVFIENQLLISKLFPHERMPRSKHKSTVGVKTPSDQQSIQQKVAQNIPSRLALMGRQTES